LHINLPQLRQYTDIGYLLQLHNFSIVLNNFQMNADLYQVDLIYVTMMPIDMKFENKFLENLNSFIIKIRIAFDNKKINSSKI
jgi:hypothetical protein